MQRTTFENRATVVEQTQPGTVFIIDDDHDLRRAISLLVSSVDLTAEQFASGRAFLDAYGSTHAGCILLDMRMPGMSGLEIQAEFEARGISLPIIFISAYGEIPNATAALRAGAVDFITKPYNPQVLLERIHEAIAIDRKRRGLLERQDEVNKRIASLTAREHEIMEYLARGDSTKVIGSRLNISTKTVDNHRSRVLEKMNVDNTTQLARWIQCTDGD